jgi:hypothetical protein
MGGVAALFQYSNLAGAVHDRQFVGKAFLLSDRDYALLVFFLCSFHQFDCLPKSNMSLVITSEDAIEES